MNYLIKTDNYTIFSDYSVEVKCQSCGKVETLPPDHKQAVMINQINERGDEYVCLNCWKKNKDSALRDNIAYGQSWNLAVAILTPKDKEGDLVELKRIMGLWQEYFYKSLTQRNDNHSE